MSEAPKVAVSEIGKDDLSQLLSQDSKPVDEITNLKVQIPEVIKPTSEPNIESKSGLNDSKTVIDKASNPHEKKQSISSVTEQT